MSDQQITCSECGRVFLFKEAEQQFYAERGLASPPKRCKECRQARKAQNGGAPGGFGGRDRGPRFGGDPNEYRAPMSGGPGGPGGGGDRPFRGGDRPRSGGGFDRPRSGGFDRPPRAGGFDRGPRPPRAGGGFDRPRSGGFDRPAAGGDRRGPPRFDSGSRPPRAEWGSRPEGERPASSPEGAEARAERPPRQRPERPRYDITCAECGTPAQVPFKPLEGRQVFCQPCYRARKGATGTPPDSAAVETDNGIVE
jgi:CxxC-x17-CxxC domain-containing protein